MLFDFHSLSIWLNLALFAVAAAVIWQAGTRLSRYADIIAERTGLRRAFVGMLLLAAATSLPEASTTITAAITGNESLAISNLLGGIAIQTAILAFADLAGGGKALTYMAGRATLLLQAASLIVLLSLTMAGSLTGEVASLAGIGAWPVVIFGCYLLAVYVEYQQRHRSNWEPVNQPEETPDAKQAQSANQEAYADHSTRTIYGFFAVGALLILIAGIALARIADALAVQTGLGSGFVGATLLAGSTSLPEVSATIGAVRVGANNLAISNVFGSNMLMVALLLVTDIFYRDGALMNAITSSEQFALSMGIAMTAVYLIGMIERRDRTTLWLGFDSIAVLILYAGTVVGLYVIR